jgi:hypothetical protein
MKIFFSINYRVTSSRVPKSNNYFFVTINFQEYCWFLREKLRIKKNARKIPGNF